MAGDKEQPQKIVEEVTKMLTDPTAMPPVVGGEAAELDETQR